MKMDHTTAIQKYIEVVQSSRDLHVVLIEGPPGWGKTTSVEQALSQAKIEGVHLGAYSTPLNLFNFLHENCGGLIVIDDCAGLFNDSLSMAILKAATWPSRSGRRIVKWGSTSSRASTTEFEFTGKLAIVCNSFPRTADADAIRSRGYSWRIDIELNQAKELIKKAAENRRWFSSIATAKNVAAFLDDRLSIQNLSKISYRTLRVGYELAMIHPDNWQELLAPMIPAGSSDPLLLVKELSNQSLKVKDQARIFEERTGLKRRSFFHYRAEAGLSK